MPVCSRMGVMLTRHEPSHENQQCDDGSENYHISEVLFWLVGRNWIEVLDMAQYRR